MFTIRGASFSVAILFSLLVMLTVSARADQRSIEDAVRSEFQNQIVVVRGFYVGSPLRFNAVGDLASKAKPGYWASDGMIRITEVSLDKHGRLFLRGQRLINGFDPAKCHFVNYLTKLKVEIEIDIDPSWQDAAPALALLNKILLRDMAGLKSIVPDYWQGWFDPMKRVERNGTSHCESAQPKESALVPQPATGKNDTPEGKTAEPFITSADSQIPKVGGDIKPPKALRTPDPKYTEAAREAGYQGTTVLWVLVDERGDAKSVRIVRPLGGGLDDRALEIVKLWKFAPATRNGIPIAVQINVEVNFRLY